MYSKHGTSLNTKQNPVVILLLGFMGAAHRHMLRYVAAYLKLLPACNVKVISVIAPVSFVLKQGMISGSEWSKDSPYMALAQDLLDLDEKINGGTGSVLIHSCSQNGAFAYRALLRQASPTWRARIVGSVFDSAPVHLTPQAVDDALLGAVGSFIGNVLRGSVRLACGGSEAYATLLRAQHDLFTQWMSSDQDGRMHPRCFLFSASDKIASAAHIHNLVLDGRKRGLEVTWHDFGGSAHVAHVSRYEYEYCVQLGVFLGSLSALREHVRPFQAVSKI